MAQLGSSKVFGNLQVTGNIVAGTTITGTTLSISGTATAVTFSGALSGNATTATTLQTARTINETSFNGSANITLNQLYRHDDRTISPSEITTGYMRFGFGAWNNNGVSPYADYLHLRSYTDSSGGNDNLVMFRKDAIGLRLYQQSYGSTTAYASYRDVAFTDSPTFTGQVVVAAGTSAAPAITTTGDTNTGIFFPSADTIAFGEGGTEVMRITSGGSVGIGTTSPLAKLDSAGNIKITNNSPALLATTTDGRGWRMGNSSSGTTLGTFYIQGTTDNFSSSFIDSFFISSAGNVGIGTASPSQKFEVSGGSAKIYGTTGGAWLFIESPDATSGMEIGFNSIEEANINVKENKDLKIGTNSQTRITVKSDGNVGIGTTSPVEKLSVSGGGMVIFGTNSSINYDGISMDFNSTSREARIAVGGNSGQNGFLTFTTSNAGTEGERMRITAAGNVGIGTTSPTAKLEVAGGISLSGTLTFNGSTGSSGQVLTSQGSSAPIWSNAGTGTVTSVAMTVPAILSVSGTPVTTSGTFALSLANQNSNLVFAGPATGAATAPTFRSLTIADIPSLSASYASLSTGNDAVAIAWLGL